MPGEIRGTLQRGVQRLGQSECLWRAVVVGGVRPSSNTVVRPIVVSRASPLVISPEFLAAHVADYHVCIDVARLSATSASRSPRPMVLINQDLVLMNPNADNSPDTWRCPVAWMVTDAS